MGSLQTSSIPINVEFTGGLEMLFSDKRRHKIDLPKYDQKGVPAAIAFLVKHLCDHVMQDKRQELFVMDGSVRPGILVLINEADWELEGEEKYQLQPNDNIIFVSTLHGG